MKIAKSTDNAPRPGAVCLLLVAAFALCGCQMFSLSEDDWRRQQRDIERTSLDCSGKAWPFYDSSYLGRNDRNSYPSIPLPALPAKGK